MVIEKKLPQPPAGRDEALVERLFRRVFESFGAAVDRQLGRERIGSGDFTTSKLISRMKRSIDERVHHSENGTRIAPHVLRMKVEWGTHSEVAPEIVKELEHELLAAAIDHINDQRYRTFAPVRIETVTDIFTTGVAIEPTFGEYGEKLDQDNARKQSASSSDVSDAQRGVEQTVKPSEVLFAARLNLAGGTREIGWRLTPGGRRLNIGRAADNDLTIDHPSVSKVHATMRLTADGKLLIADTGSTNGTYVNGRRVSYGEAVPVEADDVVSFGEVEMRPRRVSTSS